MKKIFLLPLFFIVAAFAPKPEHGCEGYYLVKTGVTLEYEDYNAKDKLQGSHSSSITKLEEIEGVLNATMHGIFKDDKGKVTNEGDYTFTCKNGEITIDMRAFMSQEQMEAYKDMEVTIDQTNLVYPATFTEGQTLPDGSLTMKVSTNGMVVMTMTMNITDRKIEKFESITTPAGTYQCVKMTQTNTMNTGFMNIKTKSIDWVSLGIGSVRSESYDKNDALQSYTILTKVSQ